MQNVIWSNDTDRIDSIVDYWKEEAARLSEDMAEDPRRVRHARTGKHDEKTLKNQRKQLDNITQMRYNGGIGKTEGHARNPKEGI